LYLATGGASTFGKKKKGDQSCHKKKNNDLLLNEGPLERLLGGVGEKKKKEFREESSFCKILGGLHSWGKGGKQKKSRVEKGKYGKTSHCDRLKRLLLPAQRKRGFAVLKITRVRRMKGGEASSWMWRKKGGYSERVELL